MELKNYIKQSLIDLGLSEGEASVYFEILKNKSADAGFLKKSTKYSFAGIYKILNSLVEKGFIYPFKDKSVRVFLPIPLADISKKIAAKGRKLNRIADKFNELDKLSAEPSETEYYENESLVDYYLNIPYKADDFIWCVGSFGAVKNFLGIDVEKEFIKKRVGRGIHCDALIFDENVDSRNFADTNRGEKRDTKFITGYNYPFEFTYLFGDSITTFYKGVDGNVKILKAQSPELARAKMVQYQMLWKANSTN